MSPNHSSIEAKLNLDYPLVGKGVIKVGDFLAALSAPASGPAQKGNAVRGSGHFEIGTVENVVVADAWRPEILRCHS